MRITGREKQILRLVNEGMVNKEIARELKISKHTVARHLQKTYAKLHVQDRFEAIDKAVRLSIIAPADVGSVDGSAPCSQGKCQFCLQRNKILAHG